MDLTLLFFAFVLVEDRLVIMHGVQMDLITSLLKYVIVLFVRLEPIFH